MKPIQFILFGFPVSVGASFLIPIIGLSYMFAHAGRPIWQATTSIIVMLIAVLVHELGHAFTFRWFGVMHCVSIHVHAIGGHVTACQICQQRLSNRKKFIVSVAGPIAGFLLAGCSFILAIISHTDVLFLVSLQLMYLNLLVSVLNLTPALPLDGGRAYEAVMKGIFGESLFMEFTVQLVSTVFSFGLLWLAILVHDPLSIVTAVIIIGLNGVRVFIHVL